MVLRILWSFAVLILLLLLNACQPKVYLMPAPVRIDKYDGFPPLGDERMSWEELYNESLKQKRTKELQQKEKLLRFRAGTGEVQ